MFRILSPEETRAFTIITMLGKEGTGAVRWLLLIVLALAAWLGGVGFLGQYRPTQVSRMVAEFAPLAQVYWGALAIAAAIVVVAGLARRGALAWAGVTIAVYLAGLNLSGFLFHFFPPGFEIPFESSDDGWRFALSRVWFAGPIALLLLIVWAIFRSQLGPLGLAFGLGNWLVASYDSTKEKNPASWLAKLFGGYFIFVVIFAVIVQLPVGFAPILSGNVIALLPALLIAAAANAVAEELVYRGFIQPAFIRYGGAAAGLWVQGFFFGIVHWGLSVGILAALPTSLLIGFGSVVWGKAAYETRGLGWTIAAHFMIDVAVMAAYFVPR